MNIMEQNLKNNGWGLAQHKLPSEVLKRLVKRKDELLKISAEEVESAFNVSFSSEFENEKVEYIELAKGMTRALLMYDPDSFSVAKAVWKQLKDVFKLSPEIKFLKLPYPIIHFPLDSSEAGTRHKDNYPYIEHFYTAWVPLNDCFHKPISIFENTHKKDNFIIRQLRIRLPFFDKLIMSTKKELRPDIRLGEFFVWPGSTDHIGRRNEGGKTTVALMIVFTSSPVMHSPSLPIEQIEKFVSVRAKNAEETRTIMRKMISAYKEIRSENWENIEKTKDLIALAEDVKAKIKKWNFSPSEAKQFAFVCTLWAQRLEKKQNVINFNFYAFFLAPNNTDTWSRCLKYAIAHFKSETVSVFINSVLRDYGTKQTAFEVKNIIKQGGEKGKSLTIQYPENLKLLKP